MEEERIVIKGQKTAHMGDLMPTLFYVALGVFLCIISSKCGKYNFIPIIIGIAMIIMVPLLQLGNYINIIKSNITVTTKRIVGTDKSGNNVDIPLDQVISAVIDAKQAIKVDTVSGSVFFSTMADSDRICGEINALVVAAKEQTLQSAAPAKLIVQPQTQQTKQPQVQQLVQAPIQQPEQPRVQPQPQAETVQATLSVADELKKIKELLDMGVINQQEFEEKKRRLLSRQ